MHVEYEELSTSRQKWTVKYCWSILQCCLSLCDPLICVWWCCFIYKELQFEECPKWLAVKDVLGEIEAEIENNRETCTNLSTCQVIIAAQDERMCSQIRDVRMQWNYFYLLVSVPTSFISCGSIGLIRFITWTVIDLCTLTAALFNCLFPWPWSVRLGPYGSSIRKTIQDLMELNFLICQMPCDAHLTVLGCQQLSLSTFLLHH